MPCALKLLGDNMSKEPFYNSPAWLRAREAALLRDRHLCVLCLGRRRIVPATVVHHMQHYKDAPDRALDLSNLQCLCARCHNKQHPMRASKAAPRRTPGGVRIHKV